MATRNGRRIPKTIHPIDESRGSWEAGGGWSGALAEVNGGSFSRPEFLLETFQAAGNSLSGGGVSLDIIT